MDDKRERLLVRMGELFAAVPGIGDVARNDVQKSDVKDTISYLDADEETNPDDQGRGRPSEAPRRVAMSPEVYVTIARRTDVVGTKLNEYRGAILKAIFTDATIKSILGTNGSIEYLGCKTDLAVGRTMIGEMGIGLTFHYIVKPAEDFA